MHPNGRRDMQSPEQRSNQKIDHASKSASYKAPARNLCKQETCVSTLSCGCSSDTVLHEYHGWLLRAATKYAAFNTLQKGITSQDSGFVLTSNTTSTLTYQQKQRTRFGCAAVLHATPFFTTRAQDCASGTSKVAKLLPCGGPVLNAPSRVLSQRPETRSHNI